MQNRLGLLTTPIPPTFALPLPFPLRWIDNPDFPPPFVSTASTHFIGDDLNKDEVDNVDEDHNGDDDVNDDKIDDLIHDKNKDNI